MREVYDALERAMVRRGHTLDAFPVLRTTGRRLGLDMQHAVLHSYGNWTRRAKIEPNPRAHDLWFDGYVSVSNWWQNRVTNPPRALTAEERQAERDAEKWRY